MTVWAITLGEEYLDTCLGCHIISSCIFMTHNKSQLWFRLSWKSNCSLLHSTCSHNLHVRYKSMGLTILQSPAPNLQWTSNELSAGMSCRWMHLNCCRGSWSLSCSFDTAWWRQRLWMGPSNVDSNWRKIMWRHWTWWHSSDHERGLSKCLGRRHWLPVYWRAVCSSHFHGRWISEICRLFTGLLPSSYTFQAFWTWPIAASQCWDYLYFTYRAILIWWMSLSSIPMRKYDYKRAQVWL